MKNIFDKVILINEIDESEIKKGLFSEEEEKTLFSLLVQLSLFTSLKVVGYSHPKFMLEMMAHCHEESFDSCKKIFLSYLTKDNIKTIDYTNFEHFSQLFEILKKANPRLSEKKLLLDLCSSKKIMHFFREVISTPY